MAPFGNRLNHFWNLTMFHAVSATSCPSIYIYVYVYIYILYINILSKSTSISISMYIYICTYTHRIPSLVHIQHPPVKTLRPWRSEGLGARVLLLPSISQLVYGGPVRTQRESPEFTAGWWFGWNIWIIFSHLIIGNFSSSQLTDSYFSEGETNHQPAVNLDEIGWYHCETLW